MQLFKNKLAASTAIAALTGAALFAQAKLAPRHTERQGQFLQRISAELNLTDDQKAQAKSIFQEARQSARPVRQQLMETRKSLRDAVQSGDKNQIQQLSAAEGTEVGQLTAIRSSALAKFYKTLTPDQQQKAETLRRK